MCNLDSIYAFLSFESVASEKRPLGSMQDRSQNRIAYGLRAYQPVFGSRIAFPLRGKALIKDGVYQTALPSPILRAGRGGGYVEVTQDRLFETERPAGSSVSAFPWRLMIRQLSTHAYSEET